jgi:hypothetical protein
MNEPLTLAAEVRELVHLREAGRGVTRRLDARAAEHDRCERGDDDEG